MKKVFGKAGMVALLAWMCALAVCGCSDGLKSACEQADKDCPVLLDEDLGKITRVEMAEGTVEMTCLLSDDGDYEVEDIREYAEDRDDFRKNFVEAFVNCRQLTPLYEAMREQRAALKVIVKDDESPKYNVYFAAEEVQDFRDSKDAIAKNDEEDDVQVQLGRAGGSADSDGQKAIAQEIEAARKLMPFKMLDFMTVQDAAFDGRTITYLIIMDEDYGSIDEMKKNVSESKSAIVQSLNGNAATKQLLALCVQNDVGIKYIYRGDTSGEECVVTLTPDDLR